MKRIQRRKAEGGKRNSHCGFTHLRIRNPQSAIRNGSTLVEVLASILALAIGVTMVATLYPVSILRSINATRLTRGTIHRHNAEAWIDVFTDQLVHNPDRAGTPLNPTANPRKHYDASLAGVYSGNNYIVDPIGWDIIRRDTDAATANAFGDPTATFGTGRLERYNGLNRRDVPPLLTAGDYANDFAIAQRIALSPDNWTPVLQSELTINPPAVGGATSADIPGVDLSGVNVGDPPSRITLFDATARFSHTRIITDITGNTVSWAATSGLPTGFTATTARIETQERHFTWLLTVRNRTELGATPADDKKKANVDVVVFFRRQYSAGTNGHENTAWNFVVQDAARRKYLIQAPGAPGAALSSPRPFLKKGAWLCDTINARWYRIQRIDNETSNAPIITLETAPPPDELLTKGVILPTVVEVYSLGTKQ
jgi:hypothetical protein